MNDVFQNYTILKMNLVPNNPVQTFLPFFVKIFESEYFRNDFTEEELSNVFKEKYGDFAKLPIIHSVLEYLKNKGVIRRINSDKYRLVPNAIEDLNIKKLNEECFNDDYKRFKKGYDDYCGNENFTDERFNSIFLKFLSKYYNTIFSESSSFNIFYQDTNEKDEEYDFMFVEYIKSLEKNDVQMFNYVVNIAGGLLITNYLFDEGISAKNQLLNNKVLILDTPVVLRVLGYCSNYYKKEYVHIFDQWKELGANIMIFDFTYEEIENLFVSCEGWIESPNYDYQKASELSNYFKYNRNTKQDISEIIINLKDTLYKMGIDIFDTKKYINDSFWSMQIAYEENIKKQYSDNNGNNYGRNNDVTIKYDSKSLSMISHLNDEKLLFQNHKYYFVTSNSALVRVFNNDKNAGRNTSVIKDLYFGLLSLGNIEKINEFQKLRLISFCSDLYMPNQETKASYFKQLDLVKTQNKIDDNQYMLLKNYYLLPNYIMEVSKGNTLELDEESIFSIYKKIESNMLENNTRMYEDKIKSMTEDFERETKNTNIEHSKEVEFLNEKNRQLKNELDTRIDLDIIKIKKKYNALFKTMRIITWIVMGVAFLALFLSLSGFIETLTTAWKIVIAAISATLDLYIILSEIMPNSFDKIAIDNVMFIILKKRLKRLYMKYKIPQEKELFLSRPVKRIE